MRKLITTLLLLVALPASAGVWRDPRSGIWFGDLCQTHLGIARVHPQPVGSACFVPQWNVYGFIANY